MKIFKTITGRFWILLRYGLSLYCSGTLGAIFERHSFCNRPQQSARFEIWAADGNLICCRSGAGGTTSTIGLCEQFYTSGRSVPKRSYRSRVED